MVLLFFDQFFKVLSRFREIQDGGPRWPPLKNDYVIPTSHDVIKPFCGRQRKQFPTYYLPIKSICHSFNSLEVLKGGGGGGGGGISPPGSGTKRKPKRNRVNNTDNHLHFLDVDIKQVVPLKTDSNFFVSHTDVKCKYP